MSTPVARVGGRVVIIDPDGRVLLIHERIEDGQTHWLTPGGGVEPGEKPHDAAVREVHEETGIAVEVGAAGPVRVTRREWSWAGVTYDQIDYYFAARVSGGLEVVPHLLTEIERQTLIGHRWWSIDELRATGEIVEPSDLAELLEVLAGASRAGG